MTMIKTRVRPMSVWWRQRGADDGDSDHDKILNGGDGDGDADNDYDDDAADVDDDGMTTVTMARCFLNPLRHCMYVQHAFSHELV